MRTETGVDNELLLVIGFGELNEEDLGGQVVDVGDAQGHQARELVCDDLEGLAVCLELSF